MAKYISNLCKLFKPLRMAFLSLHVAFLCISAISIHYKCNMFRHRTSLLGKNREQYKVISILITHYKLTIQLCINNKCSTQANLYWLDLSVTVVLKQHKMTSWFMYVLFFIAFMYGYANVSGNNKYAFTIQVVMWGAHFSI